MSKTYQFLGLIKFIHIAIITKNTVFNFIHCITLLPAHPHTPKAALLYKIGEEILLVTENFVKNLPILKFSIIIKTIIVMPT